ncbi:hypothetical protein TNCV_1152561 [Trichonephila clavipes]|nr:hypothetical protein TNCV_1152561 [Trichonephila clavipes]
MGTGKRSKTQCRFQYLIQFANENGNRAAARMFDIGESSIREWEKNEMTIINMPKKKCALRKGVMKMTYSRRKCCKLGNRQNDLIVTRNSVRSYLP